MFSSFKYKHAKYSLVKVKDIINNFKIPNCQRNSLISRIDDLNKSMNFSFKPITPLYFVLFDDNKYIIDGLHRLNVYKQDLIFLEEKIPIVEILASNEKDIDYYFKLINDTMNVHDIYKLDNEILYDKTKIIKDTHIYFTNNFPNSFKYNGKRRPYLNNNNFIDYLEIIYDKKDNFNKSEDLIEYLLNLNNKYKEKEYNWFPSKGKTNNNNLLNIIKEEDCLYFGMLPNEWYLHLDELPDVISEDKISQSLRQQVWTKYSNNVSEIKCICCNLNIINAFTFECGHIIAKSKDGKCNINNLVPICGLCNKSMGNIDMDIFMEKHNYNTNIDTIKSLKNTPK